MSDLAVLATKLAALGTSDEQFDAGARVISNGGAPDPLQAMLNVVDETVLERKLAFTADGTILNVIAAGRRLRGISVIEPAMAEAEPLIGTVLSREDPDKLDAARQVLTAVLGQATHVTVRSHPAEPFGTGGERGVSAARLLVDWQTDGVDIQPTQTASTISGFLDAAQDKCTACLHVSSGAIVSSTGDVAKLQAIWEDQVDAFLKAQDNRTTQTSGARFVALNDALDTGDSVGLVLDGEEVALFTFAADHAPQLQGIWQGSIG